MKYYSTDGKGFSPTELAIILAGTSFEKKEPIDFLNPGTSFLDCIILNPNISDSGKEEIFTSMHSPNKSLLGQLGIIYGSTNKAWVSEALNT